MTISSRMPDRAQRLLGAIALGSAAVLTLAGCSAPSDDAADAGPGSEQPAQDAVEIPADTPVGERSQWIVDALNADEDATVEEWEPLMSEAAKQDVPPEELVELLNAQMRPAKPFTVTAYQGDDTQAVVTLDNPLTDPLDMQVALDEDDRLLTIFFGPSAADSWDEPASMDEVEERLEALPAEVHALVLQGDKPVVDIASEEAAPLASMFKLYVLLAVGEEVADGGLSWDDELTLTDELRSLPSGELQDEPAGTVVTVRDAAMKMISISDNTATDLLIDRVGRERVEQAVADSGHHDPAAMRPFPTTRDLFALGWGDPADREAWVEGGEEERRALLERIAAEPLDVSVSDVTGDTVWQDGVDWFASPRDIAAVHGALQDLEDEEVRGILSENPGVAVEDWPYAAFKGGGSLGVLTGSWLVEAADGETATVVVQTAAEGEQDAAALAGAQQELFGLAQSAIAFLAE